MAKSRYERISQRAYAERLGVSNTAVSKAISSKLIVKGWDPKEQKIIVEHADKEWGNIVRKRPIVTTLDQIGKDPGTDEKPAGGKLKISSNSDRNEALRVQDIAKAQLLLIELSEKSGSLINKDLVQKTLTAYGQEIRKSFQTIPERTIDKLRAANNRNEALGILEQEITKVLERLTQIIDTAL